MNKDTIFLVVIVAVLAAAIWMTTRQLNGEIQILHDRLGTVNMNGGMVANPIPVAGEDT